MGIQDLILTARSKHAKAMEYANRIFHLVNTKHITLQTLVDCLETCGYKMAPVLKKEFQERCQNIPPDHPW